MTCDELYQLLPDLLDGTLNSAFLEKALEALGQCPECQKEFEAAQQVRDLLVKLQAANLNFQPSPGFKAKLQIRVHHRGQELALSNLSVAKIKIWASHFDH